LYAVSFNIPNPTTMAIISSVIMVVIVFVTYRAFLVYKTKLTKEFFIVNKPLIFQKTYIKWEDFKTVKTTSKFHRDREGGTRIQHII
jgi:hypothetical protein